MHKKPHWIDGVEMNEFVRVYEFKKYFKITEIIYGLLDRNVILYI